MPSAWITHVKSVYAAGKKKHSSYTYGQAMKDGKSSYKRGANLPQSRMHPRSAAKKKSKKVKKSEEDEE